MEFLGQVWAWYTDPANWAGRDGIPVRLWEHVSLSLASLLAGLAIALPIGLYIGHTGRGARVVVAISNIGRAVPSLGWLGIAYPISTGLFQRGGIGFLPAFIGLDARTVYYVNPTGVHAAYTILGGDAIDPPSDAAKRTDKGVQLYVVEDKGRRVVTWERDGHTCVLSAPLAISEQKLLDLAAWKGGGNVPF